MVSERKKLYVTIIVCILVSIGSILLYKRIRGNKKFLPKSTSTEHFQYIRLLDDGNILYWGDNPIRPYLIKCRGSKEERELCHTLLSGKDSKPTAP